MPDLWKSFYGKGNSNEILKIKAELLATVMVDWARTGTLKLIEHLEKYADNKKVSGKFSEIFLESVILYVHFADRIAFQFLKNEQRDFFMNVLMNKIDNIFSESQQNELQKARLNSVVTDIYNERQNEYSDYKISTSKDERLGGTLFWEFSKKIANIIGSEDIITMFQAQACIVGSLKFLQLPELFKE